MTNKERKEQGLVYCYDDPALLGDQHLYQNKMLEYNQTLPTETEKRQKLLKEVFAEIGSNCTVETPLNANWGCKHVHLGNGVYLNSNITFVDDEHIYIGDNSVIGAGSVVTSDIPASVVAYGVPCHVIRKIGDKDMQYYYKDKKLDVWE